jgi:peptide deformylase
LNFNGSILCQVTKRRTKVIKQATMVHTRCCLLLFILFSVESYVFIGHNRVTRATQPRRGRSIEMLPLPSAEVVASEFSALFQTISERVRLISHDNAEVMNSAATQLAGFLQAHPLEAAELGVVSGMLFMDRLMRGQNQEATERRMKELNTKLNVMDVRMSSKSSNGPSVAELAKSVQRVVEAEQQRRASERCLLARVEQMQSEFNALKSENARLCEQLLGVRIRAEIVPAHTSAAAAATEADAAVQVEGRSAPLPIVALTTPAVVTDSMDRLSLSAEILPEQPTPAPPALLRGLSALARSTLQVNLKASVQYTLQQLTQRVSSVLAEWRGRSLSAVLAVVAAVAGRGLAAKGLERLQQALAEAVEQRRTSGGEEDSGSAEEEGGVVGAAGGFRYLDSRAEVFA